MPLERLRIPRVPIPEYRHAWERNASNWARARRTDVPTGRTDLCVRTIAPVYNVRAS